MVNFPSPEMYMLASSEIFIAATLVLWFLMFLLLIEIAWVVTRTMWLRCKSILQYFRA